MKTHDAAIVAQVRSICERINDKSGKAIARSCRPCPTCGSSACDIWDGLCPRCWVRLGELLEKGAWNGTRRKVTTAASKKGATDER